LRSPNKPKKADAPSKRAKIERAFSLANEAMFTVALQVRRLRSSEPEDETFVFRWWADLQFLIVALRRLRRIANLSLKLSTWDDRLRDACRKFDATLEGLNVMRNVGEHLDDYASDAGWKKSIGRRQLQVGSWDGTTYTWLDRKLNVDVARAATEKLFDAIRALNRAH
jgi:hypothetical protein